MNKNIRNLVTGGSGFLGSHLIDRLMNANEEVICLDNNFTGREKNIQHWINHDNFKFLEHDVVEPVYLEVDRIWHLACPASPIHYQQNPIKTAKTSFLGTYNMLGLAKRVNASLFLASTSEIYGDPEQSPQSELYKGNVNSFGPRSCYDEGKRISETLCYDYNKIHNVNIRIARIFNTYGPRMLQDDGRVVSNLITQALQNNPLTINGNGEQTRSFCYVDDLINGFLKLMNSDYEKPVNLGNPCEFTINELAEMIKEKTNPNVKLIYQKMPEDDPRQRKPDISLAKEIIRWEPKVDIREGLDLTINYFKSEIK